MSENPSQSAEETASPTPPETPAGEPAAGAASGAPHPLQTTVWNEIATVEDPEIGLPLTELGLIYDLHIDAENNVNVIMTFTSMACPVGPQLKAGVHAAAARVEGVQKVDVDVVWSPPWDPREMATEEAKEYLGIF